MTIFAEPSYWKGMRIKTSNVPRPSNARTIPAPPPDSEALTTDFARDEYSDSVPPTLRSR